MRDIRELPFATEDDLVRILANAAPALIPLLELRQAQTLDKLLGEFHSGVQDLRPTTATYAAYETLLRDVRATLTKRDSQ